MPDYYRGTWVNPITDADKLPAFAKEKTVWKNLKNDWEQKIQPLAEKKGAQYYGTVGKIICKCIFVQISLLLGCTLDFNSYLMFYVLVGGLFSKYIKVISTFEYQDSHISLKASLSHIE